MKITPAIRMTVLLVFANLNTPVHAADYTVTGIESLSGPSGLTWPYAINNLGQVVGYSSTTSGNHAFVWSASSGIRDLGYLTGGAADSNARDINDKGQIVGYSKTSTGYRAVLWDTSGMRDLGDIAGGVDHSEAYGINERGHVVGLTNNASGQRPFLWTPETGLRDLGIPAGAGSATAQGINESGWIAGTVFFPDRISAFRWAPDGTATDLGDLPTNAWTSYAYSINMQGLSVGRGNVTAGDRGVLWHTDGSMLDLGIQTGGINSYAYAINRLGHIVGDTTDQKGHHAAIWKDPRAVSQKLDDLIDPTLGWRLIQATDVNDVGQIVGIGISPTGNFGGFLLTPKPTLTAFWPGNSSDGSIIFLFGSGFIPFQTQVSFNDVPTPAIQWLAGDLVLALLPPGVTSGTVRLTTPYGSVTAAVPFGTITSGLSISGIWPAQGAANSIVFVFGSGFTAGSQVSVNSVAAPAVQVMNSNLLLFLLPPTASSGAIKVVTPGGAVTSSGAFVVL